MDTNSIIADLWENHHYAYWQYVSDELLRLYGVDLSASACRARYRRFSKARDENPTSVQKNAPEPSQGEMEGNPDVIAGLRDQFGVGKEFSPKVIKTSATGGREWASVVWERIGITSDHLDAILDKIKNHAPEYEKFIPMKRDETRLLIPILFDAHINKSLVDGTQAPYKVIVQWVIQKALALGGFDRVLFVLGNDFGNIDNVAGSTTAGTPQNSPIHWARDIDMRCEYAVYAIESFATVAPVDVIMIPGNHDRYSNQWLGKVIEAWFKNNQRVTVFNSDSPRKYYTWASNMWGFSHGNEENVLYPALMATEAPKAFAEASNREMFVGHFHQKRTAFYPLDEVQGVAVRWMPALSGPDDWHRLKGYVGAKQQALGIMYHQDGYDCEFAVNAR